MAAVAQPQISPEGVKAVIAKLTDAGKNVVEQRKPWAEVFDRTAIARPPNFGEATQRIRKNANYFKVNYGIFLVGVQIIYMFMHPWSIIYLTALSAVWAYMFVVRAEPLVIGGREMSEREVFLGMSGLSLVIVFFLTSVGTILFTALGIGLTGIAVHGAIRVPDDLFLDDAQSAQGFFSFLGPSSAAAPAGV